MLELGLDPGMDMGILFADLLAARVVGLKTSIRVLVRDLGRWRTKNWKKQRRQL